MLNGLPLFKLVCGAKMVKTNTTYTIIYIICMYYTHIYIKSTFIFTYFLQFRLFRYIKMKRTQPAYSEVQRCDLRIAQIFVCVFLDFCALDCLSPSLLVAFFSLNKRLLLEMHFMRQLLGWFLVFLLHIQCVSGI